MTFEFYSKDNQITTPHIHIKEVLPEVAPENLLYDGTATGIFINHVMRGLSTDTDLILWVDPDKRRIKMTHEGVSPASGMFCEMVDTLKLTPEEKSLLFAWEEITAATI